MPCPRRAGERAPSSIPANRHALRHRRYNGGVKRRLFTITSALSLLLFVAAVVMWVRSYYVREGWIGVWSRREGGWEDARIVRVEFAEGAIELNNGVWGHPD